jgi:2-oxoglutarate ferredoxin oxidoreductase subunit beta
MKRALVLEQVAPCQTLLCFDIGCNGNGSDKIGGYRFHGLHGRVLPFACGASVANRQIKVVAFGGDGGTLGEGINHLISAVRGDYDMTFILHNNLNYGLTQGQASPTTKPEVPMNTSPDGITADPIHPMRFMLSLRPSFAARTFSGDVKHMTEVFQAGLQHRGFSFIVLIQSCPTYNKMTPHEWYQSRVKDVSQLGGYDATDYAVAAEHAEDLEEQIAIGVLYQNKAAKPFMDRQANRMEMRTELVDEVKNYSTAELFSKFR